MNNKVLIVGVLAVAVVVAGYFLWGTDEPPAPAAPAATTTQPATQQ